MNINKVFVLGRVTADPQLRTTPGGQSVSSFSVATNRMWKDKAGARQEDTEFHNIVVWGRQAEVATQFLKKGATVFIEGRLQTRTWQDKQNQTRKTTEIICEQLQLGPRPTAGGGQAPADFPSGKGNVKEAEPAQAAPAEEIPTVDLEDDIKMDDLPF
ncbi:MAG TPA: single-stranded DNA-binding protein [Candidatus Paceibacterota bacterium]|nr:single-stranded DNA-binding protein [Candidatus Paceibacterota bacterium]